MKFSPETHKIVELMAPAADAAGRTSDWVSLKNALRAWIIVHITQGNAATVALTPNQATAVAGTGTKVIPAVPIWSNLDTAASDVLVARTAAANYTTDAGVKNKIVVFQIDPDMLDADNSFDCISIDTGASNAANITQAIAVLEMRKGGASLEAVITD
jgi:2',3'-cyclic-nucleotide 2'-phosphodiesterase (5'-nucleotidase family)